MTFDTPSLGTGAIQVAEGAMGWGLNQKYIKSKADIDQMLKAGNGL